MFNGFSITKTKIFTELQVGGTSTAGSNIIAGKAFRRNSWEDGYFGNSTAMVFTPTDFLSTDTTFNNVTAVPSATPGARNYVVENAAATAQYVASKMVPKGFKITPSSMLTIWASPPVGWVGPFPGVVVQGQRLNQNGNSTVVDHTTYTTTGPPTPQGTTLTTNLTNPNILTLSSLAVGGITTDIIGDGFTQITISFVPGQALSGVPGGGLMGAQITMERT